VTTPSSAKSHLSTALLLYGGIAVGYLLVARSGGGQTAVVGLLFGSPLNLQWWEVGTIAAGAGAVVLLTAVVGRQLLAMAFDEASAKVAGIPTHVLTLILTLMVALIVVAGMTTIGLLLISAMMVVPVAAATHIANSYRATLVISSGIGALSAVAGLAASYYGDFAPGAAIVVVALLCYLVAATMAWLTGRAQGGLAAGRQTSERSGRAKWKISAAGSRRR
ncbi:metal ABC transporter permease, partial [Nesterenkonia sphaerica]